MIMIFQKDQASTMVTDLSDWTKSEMNPWKMMKNRKEEAPKDSSKPNSSIKETLTRALEEVLKNIKMEDLKNKDELCSHFLQDSLFLSDEFFQI
jgi:uncharacterized membrane-anchored protein YjiN (DUF445 family)